MSDCMPADSTPNGPRPALGSEDKLDRLRALLREMFQLDRGDLDFGLYRIMNMKAGEITAFLDNDLLPQAQGMLQGISAEDRAKLDEELSDTLATLRKLGVPNPEESDRVKDLRRQIADARADAEAEADVYGHLANFFARYYAEGDFMSQRRYSGGTGPAYLVPWDGEEVKLHWANADQYYVKTTENYASYVFTIGNERRRVRFEIAAADNEKDNVKELAGKQRRFLLARTKPVTAEGDELVLRFEHRPMTDGEKKRFPGNGDHQQGRINKAAAERIRDLDALDPAWRALLATPAPTEADPDRTVLAKHLERYTAKNTFDYFIHKDLAGFLRRELDLYLKSEVLNLDDLALGDAARLRRALARVRTIRHMADKIIAFLAQLEEFQKRLWLKKKLVLETQYCATLDRVPEALYPDIAANADQRSEWVDLLAIDEIAGDLANGGTGYTEPLTVEFLKENPYLVLDTHHFDADFTDRLLAALSDAGPLDEQMDGLLVHGENFQALNLLRRRYRGQVQCVYIDPPYNTGSDGFAYRDSYQHSTWLAMLKDRLAIARNLMRDGGVLMSSIDDIEQPLLRLLLDEEFGAANRIANMVWKGATDNNPTRIATEHEYLVWYAKNLASTAPVWKSTANDAKDLMLKEWERLRASCTSLKAIQSYFRKFVKDNREVLSPLTHYDRVDEDGPYTGGRKVHNPGKEGYRYDVIHPVTGKPCVQPARGYRFPEETMRRLLDGDKILFGDDESQIIQIKEYLKDYAGDLKGFVELDSRIGANALEAMFGSREVFKNPKPADLLAKLVGFVASENRIILDFFSGSGTTGHAVINLNRGDGARRKFILVEMADYFDTVLLPRIKKLIHSRNWKAGKPIGRRGDTRLFKYIRLESYEDTLDSLELTPPAGDLLAENPALAEDYRLRYALGEETAESACLLGSHFVDPFAYTLSVVRDGTRSEVPVDLPETFNHLIGFREESRRRIDGVLVCAGTDAENRDCLIFWRNLGETDNEALDAWFEHNRARLPDSIDLVYVNGDHTLNALRQRSETWTAQAIEPILRELMFEETDHDE